MYSHHTTKTHAESHLAKVCCRINTCWGSRGWWGPSQCREKGWCYLWRDPGRSASHTVAVCSAGTAAPPDSETTEWVSGLSTARLSHRLWVHNTKKNTIQRTTDHILFSKVRLFVQKFILFSCAPRHWSGQISSRYKILNVSGICAEPIKTERSWTELIRAELFIFYIKPITK